MLNTSKYILYLRFFKVAPFCIDDSFAYSWNSLNQRHEVVTWNAFQLTGISFLLKLPLMRNATGKEDPELPLLQRISSLELPASEVAAQINASKSSSNIHISTSTVQRRLHELHLHGQIAAKKPQLKDTNMKKRLAWAKKYKQLTLDQWKSVPWS